MVSGCEKTDVCKVIVGTSVNITADFITSKYRYLYSELVRDTNRKWRIKCCKTCENGALLTSIFYKF